MAYGPTRNTRGAGNYGEQLVQFRLADAQRINNVVQLVESQRRGRRSSVLPRAAGGGGVGGVYTGTFSGAWAKGATKTVSAGSTTYSVINHFATVDRGGKCAFAPTVTGESYVLLAAECDE